ncbi:hypothetical protein F0562_022132 [Nyssa sinensis]|uniref:Uncharacterized protein n=1 Tax=Nyssa sinensis TaxID=561372 RepID=A0A5J5BPS7_9ASTE|nr:hypothetical protein F0562_022132 [Nyssa sinensis]
MYMQLERFMHEEWNFNIACCWQCWSHSWNNPSVSPWSISVAASTIDRKFFTKVQLGNNMTYTGVSINTFGLHQMFPLIYAGDVPNTRAGFNGSQSRLCINNSLDETLVKGKIILCGVPTSGEQELLAGAVGSIQGGYTDVAFAQPLPASLMGVNEGNNIYNYIRSTRKQPNCNHNEEH